MIGSFRRVLFCPAIRDGAKLSGSWNEAVSGFEKSSSPLSPPALLGILDKFREEYQLSSGNRDLQKSMINDHRFLSLLSSCVRDIQLFTSEDLCRLIYITTIGIQWRDSTLLRGLEAVILQRMAGLSPDSLIDCIESFNALRCGSRPFWEAAISAVTNMNLSQDQSMRLVRTIKSTGTSFFKPIFVLRELYENVFRKSMVSNAVLSNDDIRDLLSVYTKWDKALKSEYRQFASSLVSRFDWKSFELSQCADILAILAESGKMETRELKGFADSILVHASNLDDPSVVTLTVGMSRVGCDKASFYEAVAPVLVSGIGKIPLSKLVSLYSIFSSKFGLVNPLKLNRVNFGPSEKADAFLTACEDRILKKISRFSIREIARIMQSAALVRRGSAELWSALITVLSQSLSDDFSETVSPEEIWGLLFAVSEMNLSLPDELRQQLVVATLERIHLLKNFDSALFFATVLLRRDLEQQTQFIQNIIQLMDSETVVDSADPSVVLMNLSLRLLPVPEISEMLEATNSDVQIYFESSRSIIAGSVLDDMHRCIEAAFGKMPERDVDIGDGLVIDFIIPEHKIAVLVSSPVQLVQDGGPSGVAVLRHLAVRKRLVSFQVLNLSSTEFLKTDEEGKINLIKMSLEAREEEESHSSGWTNCMQRKAVESEPFEKEELDLSPFVRKDRRAAHRKRAPPSDALPWVSSVLTLKSRRRKNRK